MSAEHNFVGCSLLFSGLILCFFLADKQTTALVVIGKTAAQSSTLWKNTAGKAVDGRTPYASSCSATTLEVHPWWRMDLSGSLCIGEIVIANVGADVPRLIGAVVRVGESPTVTVNSVCGSAVTASMTQDRGWLTFTCDPPLLGRFISVDIDHEESESPVALKVCEMFVTESFSTECPNVQVNKSAFLDTTCYTPSPLIYPDGDDGFFLGTYMGNQDASASISFGRKSNTGHPDSPGLPAGSHPVNHPSGDTSATLLFMPRVGGISRIGAFFCRAEIDDVVTEITMIVLPKNEAEAHIRPLTLTKTVNVGESVTLEMKSLNQPNTDIRWRHNGGPFIDRSQNSLSHVISSACLDDTGVYECHYNFLRPLQLHGIMRLIVRACPSGRWGTDFGCTFLCPNCYNGGICDDKSGRCICAPGFKGTHCEEVLGRDVFAQDGSHYCMGSRDPHGYGCQGKLMCLPDPYGCSCAAGYKGLDCMQECEEGTYGADCKQTCHCATNVTCLKDTGECLGECATSYFGVNCQQTACPAGKFGVRCQQTCHCASSATCHQDSGECDGPCATTYFGPGCQHTDFNGVKELVSHATDSPEELFVMWSRDSASFYSIAYELINRGQCESIDSPKQVLVPDVVGGDTTSFTLKGLEPASLYRVYVQSHYGVLSNVPKESFTTASTIQRQDPLRVEDLTVTVTPNGFVVGWQPVQCAEYYCLTSELIEIGQCDTAIHPGQNFLDLVTNETSMTLDHVEPFSTYRISVLAMIGSYNGSAVTTDVKSSSAAPDPPNGLSLASSSANTLLFTWNDLQCVDYRGVFEGYRFHIQDTATEDIVASGTTMVAEVGFTGLVPCQSYAMKVAAISSGLNGPYSDLLVITTGEKAPGPVSEIKIIVSSSTGLAVSWQPPLSNGCRVDEYRVDYVINTQHICWTNAEEQSRHSTVLSNRNSTVLTDLLSGTQYQMYVTAVNSAGSGPSMSVIFSTDDSAPTAPPEDVTIFAGFTSQSLGFSWSEPPCRERGGIITQYTYRLTYNNSSELEIVTSSQDTTNEWILLGGLKPDTNYCFRVAAWTSAGKGPESQCIRAKTDKVLIPSIKTLPNSKPFTSEAPANFPAAAVVIALVCIVVAIIGVFAVVRFKNRALPSRRQVSWNASPDGPEPLILSDITS